MLLEMAANKNLPMGSLAEVAEKFQTNLHFCFASWQHAKLYHLEYKLMEKEMGQWFNKRSNLKHFWKKCIMYALSKEFGMLFATKQVVNS